MDGTLGENPKECKMASVLTYVGLACPKNFLIFDKDEK